MLTLAGPADNGTSDGSYRGVLEFSPGVGGLLAVNALPLEQYVAGVISAEVPGALARPGAARAGDRRAHLRDHDERRRRHVQPVRGHALADVPRRQRRDAVDGAAVRETANLVVTYGGKPVTTYFFSTSGGRTENVENSFIGGQPKPWLKSVKDPYDDVSPSHRWGPIKLSIASASAKLRGLAARPPALDPRASARRLTADRARAAGRQRRHRGRDRPAAAPRARAARRVDQLHDLLHRPDEAAQAEARSLAAGVGDRPADRRERARRARRGRRQRRDPPAHKGDWAQVQRLVGGRWVLAVDVEIGRGGRYATAVPPGGATACATRDDRPRGGTRAGRCGAPSLSR